MSLLAKIAITSWMLATVEGNSHSDPLNIDRGISVDTWFTYKLKNSIFMKGAELAELSHEFERVESPNRTPGDSPDIAAALRFITFVTATSDAFDGALFCVPKGATSKQLAYVVRKYLRDNPEKWTQSGSYLASDSLAKAFPCK